MINSIFIVVLIVVVVIVFIFVVESDTKIVSRGSVASPWQPVSGTNTQAESKFIMFKILSTSG